MYTEKEKSPGPSIFTRESTDLTFKELISVFPKYSPKYMTQKTTDIYPDEYICNNLQ